MIFVIGKSRHLLTARKRQLFAAWDLPRKSKNLRPCAVHFGVLHKVFFLLILSLQITQLPLLSSPSGHEQTQKWYPFFSGQTPILPHHIIVSTQRNGQEIPVFFSSRFWREKIGSRKGPATFLNNPKHFSTFSYQFLLFLWSYLAFSAFFREKRENEIWKKKEPYRASQSLIEASFNSSYDTRKDEEVARSQEGNWQEMIGKFWEKEKKKEGKIPTRKVTKNYNYNGKVYSS